ncbi:MAG: hypothetical protein HQ504_03365 [Rhodospirillaceae bacterium]|nr:hypothetical protein [Rhodospirillaceae bacterium]
MALFLSVAALLLAISAIVIGVEALKRLNNQNEEFLKAYVREIRNDLTAKDEQIVAIRMELTQIKKARAVSQETILALEGEQARKRQAESGMTDAEIEFSDRHGNFIPSQQSLGKKDVG